jgi:predicted ATP-grasp superfamily ATP-dependent carboligase
MNRRIRSASSIGADTRVPALLLKIGQYPLHSGGVAVIRTLGRLGVPVYAVTEDRLTPSALSRYCTGSFVWRSTGHEEPDALAAQLREVGERLGRRAVVVPVDDEAAVLVAEHGDELSEHFLFPHVEPGLPRALASKQQLYELCRRHDVPVPVSMCPATDKELAEFAATATFPVVVKNAEPWTRRRAPVVSHTTVLHTAEELLAVASSGNGRPPGVIVQEYIPRDQAQDWIVHLYCDANSNCAVMFTGVKVRSWPPHNGATACAYTLANPELAQIAERFCKAIGFRGIADLDWRLDLRDGRYKLVDFNPRVGNQFRLFETEQGIDVVRALYLDLTGRAVPAGAAPDGRRIIIEHVDVLARFAYRGGSGYPAAPSPPPVTATELAWLAKDDPLPFLAMWPRLAKPLASARHDHGRAKNATDGAR